jgi:AcrR family transcriptional regulator
MKKQAIAQATRQRLLVAAAQIIQAQGTESLTLEAVAFVAGVSKGGLLYHFPNKLALIAGMIEGLLQAFDLAIEQELVHMEGPLAGRWLRAYLRATFTPAGQQLELTAGLLAAVAMDPVLLEPLRVRYAVWQQRAIADGLDPTVATMIRLTLDGLWMADLLRLAAPTGAQRDLVKALLLRLASTTHMQGELR